VDILVNAYVCIYVSMHVFFFLPKVRRQNPSTDSHAQWLRRRGLSLGMPSEHVFFEIFTSLGSFSPKASKFSPTVRKSQRNRMNQTVGDEQKT
jgi:hypothetical protein